MGAVTKDIQDIPAEEEFSAEDLAQVDEAIKHFKGMPGALIPCLHRVQGILGYLPYDIQRRVAIGLNLSASEVLGVVSFYSFYSIKPRGRWIVKVCLGTACYVKGGNKIDAKVKQGLRLEEGETTEDRRFSFEVVRCLGACGKAPVVVVNQDTHGLVDPDRVMEMLNKYE